MSMSDKISVKLEQPARWALGMDYATLDLKPGFAFRLSKQVEQLSEAGEFIVEAALPFSVPYSDTNHLALQPFSSAAIVDNNQVFIEAIAYSGGLQLPFNRIYLRGRNDVAQEYELEFRVSSEHWAYLASKKYLNTVALGFSEFTNDMVYDNWLLPKWEDGADPFYFPFVDFGNWVDLSEPAQFTDAPVKKMALEDLRYHFSLVALMKQGFCEIGWTLQGSILDTALFRSAWVYILKRNFYSESKGGTARLIVRRTNELDLSAAIFMTYVSGNQVAYDPGANAYTVTGITACGITNPLPYRAPYKFILKSPMQSAIAQTIGIRVVETTDTFQIPTGQILSEEKTISLGASETRFVEIEFDVELDPGQTGALYIDPGMKFLKGMFFEIVPAQQSLIRGDTVELSRLIHPDYTLLGLFKGFLQLINGQADTDWNSRVITVYPDQTSNVFSEIIAGFVLDDTTPIDISGKTVCNSAKFTPIRNSQKRFTRLMFADSTDAFIEDSEALEPPHSRKIINDINLPDGVTEIKNPFFEPTVERQNDELRLMGTRQKPFLPVMMDNTSGEMSFDIGPRILFAHGYLKQFSPKPTTDFDVYCGLHFEGFQLETIPYATQKRTQPILDPTQIDGSFVFGTLPFDLYVTFWLGISQVNKRGVIYDILVWIGQLEYRQWNFRTKFLFVHDGRQIVAYGKSLRDFSTSQELPTPMQLLVLPADTACCDQPCSCRFRECTYYQDLGPFVQQITLDELQITSFIVDGVEYIVAPVSLGIISLAQIAGRPYCTNLVDTLNALGIPYFTFGYSSRIFTPKDDLRFFTIKHPLCQGFEIVIEDTSGPVYRYTHDSQQQAWFGGPSWSDLGYGSEFYSEPENCINTTEF
jgi:hypothetical protein